MRRGTLQCGSRPHLHAGSSVGVSSQFHFGLISPPVPSISPIVRVLVAIVVQVAFLAKSRKVGIVVVVLVPIDVGNGQNYTRSVVFIR